MRRVVVTGMAGLSPIGNDWDTISSRLKSLESGVVQMPLWAEYKGLKTNVAGKVNDFALPSHYDRKRIRSMGRVALLATRASELALEQAGLLGTSLLSSGKLGVAYGSSSGSPEAIVPYAKMKFTKEMKGISATSYIQMMSHTCAANISLFFGTTGRIIPTCSACTSASQAIGYALESIRHGYQDIMIAGGAEELCPSVAAVFDVLYATSTRNEEPKRTPRPFDVERDGLVIAEGASTLILEEMEHARARGATIFAEVVGFGTNADGAHITQPSTETMQEAMKLSLSDAGIPADAVGYISAHATATELGDLAEAEATNRVFGPSVAISSLKGYVGHTLGACGALESWTSIQMMNEGWFAPTLNLENVDPRCAELNYLQGEVQEFQTEYIMNNNFAFGGINTSLIYKRWA